MLVAAVNMAPEAWILIAAIVGATVILCLTTVGRLLEYEIEFVRVVGQIKILRARHLTSIADEGAYVDEVEVAEPVIDLSVDLDSPDDDGMADLPMPKAA